MNKYQKVLKNKKFQLKYFMFDWDDNILFMPTKLYIEKNVDGKWVEHELTTAEFRDIMLDKSPTNQWRFKHNNINETLINFKDNNYFINDVKKALKEKKFAPAFFKLKNALIEGNLFLIITARGHEPQTLRKGVEYIIFHHLSQKEKNIMKNNLNGWGSTNINELKILVDKYLSHCDFIGTDSEYFRENFTNGKKIKAPEGKKIVIEHFIKKLSRDYIPLYKDARVKINFSDDNKENLYTVENYMKNKLSLIYSMELSITDTSNPSIKNGITKKIN